MVPRNMSLTEQERKVLGVLERGADDGCCYCFATIASDAKLDRTQVREAARSLRGKGLARYERALWSEDGEPRGSGYGLTREGRNAAESNALRLCGDCEKVFVEAPATQCAECDVWWKQLHAKARTG